MPFVASHSFDLSFLQDFSLNLILENSELL